MAEIGRELELTIQAAFREAVSREGKVSVPMVVVYRLSPLTYALGRRFVRVSTYAMVNLIAERPVVPELIQHDCTPSSVASEIVRYLTDAPHAEQTRQALAEVRARLGPGGASERAARAILAVAREKRGGTFSA